MTRNAPSFVKRKTENRTDDELDGVPYFRRDAGGHGEIQRRVDDGKDKIEIKKPIAGPSKTKTEKGRQGNELANHRSGVGNGRDVNIFFDYAIRC